MVVFTIKIFCIIISISSILVQYGYGFWPPSHNLHDEMGWRDKEKIKLFSEELFKKSMLAMRQIIEIRNEHDMFISYNVGMLMGRIREKYRFMSETYRQIVDTFNNASWFYPPGIKAYRPIHFIMNLERMHYLELEIDKLVDVMVDEAQRDVISSRILAGQTDRRGPESENRNLHSTTNPRGLRSQSDILREAAEKSFIRERFLMKKLGNPANMTTAKKRFLQNWPVEDSWALDKYNHDYK